MNGKKDELSFQVYLNYVRTIGKYLKEHTSDNIKDMFFSSSYQKLQTQRNVDINALEKILRNAWLTEQQIIQSCLDQDFIYISNHWICVKVYYCIYLALRVLNAVLGKDIKDSHAAIFNVTSQEIKRGKFFPQPWAILCTKDSDAPECYFGMPEGVLIDHSVSALRRESDFYNIFTKLLKTTRQRLLEKKYGEERKNKKKKKLLKVMKEKIDKDLYPTSLFDFLYRLRVRSNYEDADMFFSSGDNQDSAIEFNEGMRIICDHTLLLLESTIAKCLSMKTYKQIIENFQTQYSRSASTEETPCAVKRWEIIRNLQQVINQTQNHQG